MDLSAFAGEVFVEIVVHGGDDAGGEGEIFEVVGRVWFCGEDVGSLEGWFEEGGRFFGGGLLGECGLDGAVDEGCGEGAAGGFEAEV